MNDENNFGIPADEIDAILAEIREKNSAPAKKTDEPSKTWSMEDVDRLIAQANGEEYTPKSTAPLTPAEDFERILSREFDTDIFTVRPMASVEKPAVEMQDISSSSGEVDGQETFFDGDEEFDSASFELETIIVPDDIPDPPKPKYQRESEPEPEQEPVEVPDAVPEIRVFDDDPEVLREIFKKKTEGTVSLDDGHIDESEYRTRFFKKISIENTDEVEVEPTGPVDISGILIEKGISDTKSDLDPMPRVLAAENAREIDEAKTRVVGVKKEKPAEKPVPHSDDVDGQIILTGFDDIPEEILPEQTNANDVEVNLWERRRQKAKNFRIADDITDLDSDFDAASSFSVDEAAREEKARKKEERRKALLQMDEQTSVDAEYCNPDERAEMHSRLTKKASSAGKSLLITGILEVIVIIFNLMPTLTEKLSVETTLFAKGSVIFYVINALFLIAAAAFDNIKFYDGITNVFKGRITADSAVALGIAAALIQDTVAAVFLKGEYVAVFPAAAIFGLVLSKATDFLDAERILGNFEVCAFKYEHNMYAVHPLENEAEIFELGRGLKMGNAELLYSSKLAFPTELIKNSSSERRENRLVRFAIPFTAFAAAAAAVLAGIFTKDFQTTLSAFAGTFCICIPVFASFIPSFILSFNDYALNKAGTMVVSLDEAEKISSANAVIMDSADIFSRSNCTMHGMKDFKNIRIDDVLLYAAALVIKSGGPLRECFEQVIDGRQDILPQVKELNYEDKLGISGRIHNQKILLGNRSMLINHNIEIPEKALEEKYSHSGRKVIYLAVAEKMAAMFVVSYAVDENLVDYLRVLEANGIQMLVRTNDVNVTEELVSGSFGLPQENFRILSSAAGKLFKRRRDAVTDKLPAGIVHDGTAYSMLRAVASCCNMISKYKLGIILQIIISVLGFVFSAALFCTGSAEMFTGITTFLFLAAGLMISSVLVFVGRTK